jgi:hypothetical protein
MYLVSACQLRRRCVCGLLLVCEGLGARLEDGAVPVQVTGLLVCLGKLYLWVGMGVCKCKGVNRQ